MNKQPQNKTQTKHNQKKSNPTYLKGIITNKQYPVFQILLATTGNIIDGFVISGAYADNIPTTRRLIQTQNIKRRLSSTSFEDVIG